MNGNVTYPGASQFRIRLLRNDIVISGSEILVTGPMYNYSLQGNGNGDYKIEVWLPDTPGTTFFSSVEPMTDCALPTPVPIPIPIPIGPPTLWVSSACSADTGTITVTLPAGNYTPNRFVAYLEKYESAFGSFQGNQPGGFYYLNPTISEDATYTFINLSNGQYRVLLLDNNQGGEDVYTTSTQVITCPLPVPQPVPVPVPTASPTPVPIALPTPAPVPVAASTITLEADCDTFSVSGNLVGASSVTIVLRKNGVQVGNALVDNRSGSSLMVGPIANTFGEGAYTAYAFQPGNESNSITSTVIIVSGCTTPTPNPTPNPIPIPIPSPAPIPIPVPTGLPTITFTANCLNSSTGQVQVTGGINLPGVSQFRYRLRKDGVDIGSTETLVNGSSTNYDFSYYGGTGTYQLQVWNTANPIVENYLSDSIPVSCSLPTPQPAPVPIPIALPQPQPVPTPITPTPGCTPVSGGSMVLSSGSINAGEEIIASMQSLSGTGPFTYQWTYTGGQLTSYENDGQQIRIRFDSTGSFTISALIANDCGQTTHSQSISVGNTPTPAPVPIQLPQPTPQPAPVPTPDPTPNCIAVSGGSLGSNRTATQGETIVFSVDGLNGNVAGPFSFAWSATNGAVLTSGGGSGNYAAQYSFPNSGTSTVSVTVSNNCSSQTYSVTVTVPVACDAPAFSLQQTVWGGGYFRILVTGTPGDRVKYSAGSSYSGNNDCSGSYTPINSSGEASLLVFIPSAGTTQDYAVRVYKGADCSCFSTQTITVTNQIGTANVDFRWAGLTSADFDFRIVSNNTGGELNSNGGPYYLGGSSGGSALAAISFQRCEGFNGNGIYRLMISCVKMRNAGYSGEITFDVYAKVTQGANPGTIFPTVSSTIGGDMTDSGNCLGFDYTGISAGSNANGPAKSVPASETYIGQYYVNLNTNASGWR